MDHKKAYSFVKYDFDRLQENSKIILYGAGETGKSVFWSLKQKNMNQILCFADKEAYSLYRNVPSNQIYTDVLGLPVIEPAQITSVDFDFIFVTTLKFADEVHTMLRQMGVDESKIMLPQSFTSLEACAILGDVYC